MADEPVVVSKARPVKAIDGVEDKTKPTISNMSDRVNLSQKHLLIAKGEVIYKSPKNDVIYDGFTNYQIR
ncbi:hypothetical protein EIJ81_12090 [Aliivibrio salmonicida]|nr:hypothetical protein EIJ81_12090 [Aliivibrio salmonicida]